MSTIALIGGTGFAKISQLDVVRKEVARTPFGEPSSPLVYGRLGDQEIIFLARHGHSHTIPPHKINYRANIWALKEQGVTHVIALAAVGGITTRMKPAQLVIPDQIVDYTYSRSQTFYEDVLDKVVHIDFTDPYCETLRQVLISAAEMRQLSIEKKGTYAATQGPRLESAAEINKLERDGCDIVGMTGMPEAALAREVNLCYASCAIVANWAAGRSQGAITMEEIEQNLTSGAEQAVLLLRTAVSLITDSI